MHVTVVGGGFGGIRAATELAKNPANEITLISDRPTFQYYPSLYSSATGHSHMESWAPLGEVFADHENIHVYIDEIVSVSPHTKVLTAVSGTKYHYETVIFALGVVTSCFGIPGLETYAYGIKSDIEIQKLKQRLFIDIAEKRRLDRNYVIIGGGPTGVELAAAMGTYIKRLCRYYDVKDHGVKIRLIEAMPRVLPRLSKQTSRRVARRMRQLGVRIETNKKVEKERARELIVNGKTIESHTVIWTSGVSNHPFFSAHPDVFRLSAHGRVEVDEFLCAFDDIYVIGDNAETPYSGLAQTAIRDATFVACNLEREARGKPLRRYTSRRPVSAIPVGSNWAAVEWGRLHLYGFVGGLIRRAADLVGHAEVLPFGMSLGAWRASKVYEHDYFTPTIKTKRPH